MISAVFLTSEVFLVLRFAFAYWWGLTLPRVQVLV